MHFQLGLLLLELPEGRETGRVIQSPHAAAGLDPNLPRAGSGSGRPRRTSRPVSVFVLFYDYFLTSQIKTPSSVLQAANS